jgi:hypothetical protein
MRQLFDVRKVVLWQWNDGPTRNAMRSSRAFDYLENSQPHTAPRLPCPRCASISTVSMMNGSHFHFHHSVFLSNHTEERGLGARFDPRRPGASWDPPCCPVCRPRPKSNLRPGFYEKLSRCVWGNSKCHRRFSQHGRPAQIVASSPVAPGPGPPVRSPPAPDDGRGHTRGST